MAHEEAMVIAFTTSVFCALGVHTRIIRAKKQKHAVWVRLRLFEKHNLRHFDTIDVFLTL